MLDILFSGQLAEFWMQYYLALAGSAISILLGLVVFAKQGRGPGGYVLKGIAVTSICATAPLTLHQIGLNPHRFSFPYQGLNNRLIGPTEEGKVIGGILA